MPFMRYMGLELLHQASGLRSPLYVLCHLPAWVGGWVGVRAGGWVFGWMGVWMGGWRPCASSGGV